MTHGVDLILFVPQPVASQLVTPQPECPPVVLVLYKFMSLQPTFSSLRHPALDLARRSLAGEDVQVFHERSRNREHS